MKRTGRRGAIGIHITGEHRLGLGGAFEAFDQRTAFADGFVKIQRLNLWEFFGNFFYHAQRVIAATIEHYHRPKFARIIFPKVLSIITQHRPDAFLLVVRGDEQQHARLIGNVSHHERFTGSMSMVKIMSSGKVSWASMRARWRLRALIWPRRSIIW